MSSLIWPRQAPATASYFQIEGWLPPLILALFRKAFHAGFGGMTEGVKLRAEKLWAERKGQQRPARWRRVGGTIARFNCSPRSSCSRWPEFSTCAICRQTNIRPRPGRERPDVLERASGFRTSDVPSAADQPAPMARLTALASLAPDGAFGQLRGSQLLAERAAIFGHGRRGPVSPGGSCQLLRAVDGHIALNLARAEIDPAAGLLEDERAAIPGDWSAL